MIGWNSWTVIWWLRVSERFDNQELPHLTHLPTHPELCHAYSSNELKWVKICVPKESLGPRSLKPTKFVITRWDVHVWSRVDRDQVKRCLNANKHWQINRSKSRRSWKNGHGEPEKRRFGLVNSKRILLGVSQAKTKIPGICFTG